MAGPLDGLKILDFTTLLPGTYATLVFSDLGAEILRIVSRTRPNIEASMPPFIPNTNISAHVAYLGRGKRSMTLNLKDSRAINIVHRLIKKYDIIIEQFRPGVMKKLQLDYQRLQEVNPSIIYCSLTGYGQTGPFTFKAGHDINYLARSGIISYSGRKETGPTLMGIQIADLASGSFNSVIGILSAVIHRNRSGKGQYVDISMTDGVIAFNALVGTAYLLDGQEIGPEGHFLNGGSLYDFYETKDGKFVSFGGLEPKFFYAFCQTIGRPDLISGGVSPPDLQRVKEEVKEIIKAKTRDEWVGIFSNVDACVEPVLTISEALNDPQVKERRMVVEIELPKRGEHIKQLANPIKFSETQQEYRGIGLPAETHTKEIMMEIGYTEKEIEEFEKTGLFN